MALVDVSRPVVINATTEIPRQKGDHLRRVCLVSFGWSNLEESSFKEVYSYNWKEISLGYKEFNNKCESFFAQASLKGLVILELGKQQGTPLPDNYQNLLAFCETNPKFNVNDYYRFVFEIEWDKDKTATGKARAYTKDVLIAFFNSVSPNEPFDANSYQNWCNINQKDPDEISTYEEYFNLILDRDWKSKLYTYLANNNAGFKASLKVETLRNYVNSLTGENRFFVQADYLIYLEENGTKNSDFTEKIDRLNDFITKGTLPSYIYLLPQEIGNDVNLAEELFARYNDLNNSVYFFLGFRGDDYGAAVTTNGFRQVDKQKSAGYFVSNVENYDLSAATAGLFSSPKFDLSQTNPASPFNYKVITGARIKILENPVKKEFIQKSVNFMDSIAHSNVLLNGRYGDTVTFDYRYQWDLTSFQIEADLKTLILNGVNNPLYVIKYDQDGIDIIKSRVKSTLSNMIAMGAVTEYAKGLNNADNKLEEIGEIEAIPFREYITQRPDDYQNEIYGGISFYLRIGRYIKQVVLNITLG